MYNLCFVAQVKTMYKECCEAEDEDLKDRKKRAGIIMFGDEPPQVDKFEEEDPVCEDEDEQDDKDTPAFGISEYLIFIPYTKLKAIYIKWRYGE